MIDWKKVGKKLLFPPLWVMGVLAVAGAIALTVVFAYGSGTSPVACVVVYVPAFYTLSVICVALFSAGPKHYRKVRQKICGHRLGNRLMTDAAYRMYLSLHISFGINLLYAAANLLSGILYRSVWSITLSVYYLILAVMRFLLLRFVWRVGIGQDREKELKRARLCGMILMTTNLALSGVIILVIVRDRSFAYSGILIYAMAMYTFYVTVHSVVSIFRYRKYNSPVMSAAKSVSLVAAMVSMLSLTVAMLSRFGDENTPSHFRRVMVGSMGAAICVVVVMLSVYMIVRANKELKMLRIDHS